MSATVLPVAMDRPAGLWSTLRGDIKCVTAIVGDDVTLYHGVTLGGTSWSPGRRHPTLGSGVLVGAGAKILGAITVESNARVGANSVVIEDVPPGMTVVGIPGRIVRDSRDRRRIDGRIDLEHHLMPDPVGEALSVLIDHIGFPEARLAHLQRRVKVDTTPSCSECDKETS